MNKIPFIHLFQTSEGNYCYDVNTDCILKISESEYDSLNKVIQGKLDMEDSPLIVRLKELGYLKADKVKIVEHPDTHLMRYHCDRKVEGLILQVTQNCNLRCDYCAYSGGYKNRVHNNKRMTEEIAFKAIDFLIEHSKDSPRINISFYGGEPLLEFKLMKKCIEYAKNSVEGKYIHFNFTTNGTLLNDDVMDFLVKHNVLITISLDGPEEVHDKNRKYANSDKGSFMTVMENLQKIQEKYPGYFETNISYNIVLETENYNVVKNFFCDNDIFKGAALMPTLVADVNSKKDTRKSEKFVIENRYSIFLAYLHLMGRITLKNKNFLETQMMLVGESRKGKIGKQRSQLPEKWHHGGPCIPGVMRLFVDVNGNFYPCEKVSEDCKEMIIGNLEDGFDLQRIEEILNIERKSQGKCFECWAYSECKMCIGSFSIDDSPEAIERRCITMRQKVENNFKDYCVLRSLGVDFEVGIVEHSFNDEINLEKGNISV